MAAFGDKVGFIDCHLKTWHIELLIFVIFMHKTLSGIKNNKDTIILQMLQ